MHATEVPFRAHELGREHQPAGEQIGAYAIVDREADSRAVSTATDRSGLIIAWTEGEGGFGGGCSHANSLLVQVLDGSVVGVIEAECVLRADLVGGRIRLEV